MGAMMAPRPGSTFQTNQIPAQGGKAAQPTPALMPNQPQPQSPYRPIGSQGGKGGGNIDPVRPRPFENNPGAQIPAQGGKTTPPTNPNIPAQGGKTPLTPEQQAHIAAITQQSIQQPAPAVSQGGKGISPVVNAVSQTVRAIPPRVNTAAQNIPAPAVVRPTLVPPRGPAPRTIQPMVTQGLAGLVNRRR